MGELPSIGSSLFEFSSPTGVPVEPEQGVDLSKKIPPLEHVSKTILHGFSSVQRESRAHVGNSRQAGEYQIISNYQYRLVSASLGLKIQDCIQKSQISITFTS